MTTPRPLTDHDEIVRLYGPWLPHVPADAVDVMAGYPGPWCVAGGWAIEAATGVHRPHGDLDLAISRADVPLLRTHLVGAFDVWAADAGALSPLTGPVADTALPDTCGNVWLRRGGAHPWEYDVLLMTTDGGTWRYQRDARITLPLAYVVHVLDGVPYLRPEVQLLHKAPGRRPQDVADLEASLPVLDDAARTWLRDALDLAHPGHPWAELLG